MEDQFAVVVPDGNCVIPTNKYHAATLKSLWL